jgi:hypothetical protein
MVIAQNFYVPFGHGRQYGSKSSKPVDAVLGGWTLGSITTFCSGVPFSPIIQNYGSNLQPSAGPNNRPAQAPV